MTYNSASARRSLAVLAARRAFTIAATGVAWMMLTAAAAEAMTLGTGADPVESVTTQIIASGYSSGDDSLHVTEKPTGGQGCGANPQADTGTSVIAGDFFAPGPYTDSVNWTPENAGSYLLCGWLEDSSGNVVDSQSTMFSVRTPRLSISISAPPTVRPNQIFQIATTAEAEAQRGLYEYLIPNTGDGCPANSDAASHTTNEIGANFNTWYVDGGPSTQSYNQSFESTGSWLICAYFQYQSGDAPPEATASAALRVAYPPPPPPPCIVPSYRVGQSLSSVERALLAHHCAIGPIWRPYSRRWRAGDVLALSPTPGRRYSNGHPVGIVVSRGHRHPRIVVRRHRKHRR